MEVLERLEALPGRDELDREAGHLADGEDGAAAAVGVHLRDHDAGALDRLVELLGDRHGLLAGHRVHNNEHLGRIHLVCEGGEAVRGVIIEGDRADGVHDDRGDVLLLRLGERALCDIDGGCFLRLDVARDIDRLREHLQLFAGGDTLEVGGDEEGAVPLVLEAQREAAREGGLAGALRADDEDLDRPAVGLEQRGVFAAERANQLVVDDADDLLAGRDRGQNLLPEPLLAHAGDEVTDDLEVDVRFEERDAHLAQGFVELLLADAAAGAEASEGVLESFGEGVEHASSVPKAATRRLGRATQREARARASARRASPGSGGSHSARHDPGATRRAPRTSRSGASCGRGAIRR